MILTRYILKQHIAPFIFSMVVIIFIFLLNILFRDLGRILSRGIDIFTIFEFLFLNLAWIIALAVPMSVLISTLTTFGRLSADNEITALKASGISFYRIIFPVAMASMVLMAGLIIYNDYVLPHFNHQARLLIQSIFQKRPTLKIEPNVVFTDIPEMNLLTESITEKGDSSLLKNVYIDDFSGKKTKTTIFAKRGKLKFDKSSDRLFLDLYNGEIHEINTTDYSKYRKLKFERHRITVDIPGLSLKRHQSEYRGDREKSIAMMKEDIARHKQSIAKQQASIQRIIRKQLRRNFVPELIQKSETEPLSSDQDTLLFVTSNQARILQHKLKNFKNQIRMEQRVIRSYLKSIDELRVEIHKKYSIPVACIVFVLIGAPLGILTRKGNMGVAAGISVLFYLVYWVFLIGGEELADRQIISPVWAMWAPNVIVGGVGIYLVLLSVKEYRPIQWKRLKLKRTKTPACYE